MPKGTPAERMAARLEHVRWRRLSVTEANVRNEPAWYHAYPSHGTRRHEPTALCGHKGLPSNGGARTVNFGDACPRCAKLVGDLAAEP